jgi:hypothetical protein
MGICFNGENTSFSNLIGKFSCLIREARMRDPEPQNGSHRCVFLTTIYSKTDAATFSGKGALPTSIFDPCLCKVS